jgi:hypothetical protein
MYSLGEGRPRDNVKAGQYFEEACGLGNPSSCTSRGKLLFDNEDRARPTSDASARFYMKGCEGGDALGCAYLAIPFEHGRLSKAVDGEAKAMLERSCRPGATGFNERAPCRALEARTRALSSVESCKKGDAQSCALAGKSLRAGTNLPKDPKGALEVLTIGCNDLRDAASCAELGALHRSGDLGKPDPKAAATAAAKSLQLAEPRCAAGEAPACAVVGVAWLKGDSGKRDPKRARDALLKACEKDLHCADLFRAYLLSSADPVADPAVEKALSESCGRNQGGVECAAKELRAQLTEAQAKCARGQIDGCAEQARVYRQADLHALSVPLHERACQKGVLASCASLVEIYGAFMSGDVPPSPEKQKRPLAAITGACEKNDVAACEIESELRRWGRGVPRDEAAASRLRGRSTALLEEACGRGVGAACARAGTAHQNALGIPKNHERARELFERGCTLKHAESCRSGGMAFERGTGHDSKRAAALYASGCDLGDAPSCRKLRSFVDGGALDAEAQDKATAALETACKKRVEDACPPAAAPPESTNGSSDGGT